MEAEFDPYLILGVSSNATADDIHKAYRRLVLTLHPDHNQHDSRATLRFQLVQRAYDLLRDSERRREWDSGGTPSAGRPSGPEKSQSMRDLDCPICGGKFAIPEAVLKRPFNCLLCNAQLTMPGVEAPPPPPPPPPPNSFGANVQPDFGTGVRLKTRNRIKPRGYFERLGWFGWVMLALAVIRVLTWMLK